MVCFLLLAAVFPSLYWDKGADTARALKQAGIERVYVPAALVSAWSNTEVEAIAVDPATLTKLDTPGVQYRMNEASATSVPWIDANGWRFPRTSHSASFYYDVPAAAVPLAMAESYVYGRSALVHATADPDAFIRMLAFLRQIDRPPLPVLVNIGLIDDGSSVAGEAMNLLTRRNLLFRIVKAPDLKLDLNVNPAKDGAADPFAYAQQVRQKLGDEKRLVRLYGSDVVIARLTGDGTKARLHLINYSNRKVVGMRVRLRGQYAKGSLAAFGVDHSTLVDYTSSDGTTEFTVSEMSTYAVIDLSSQ